MKQLLTILTTIFLFQSSNIIYGSDRSEEYMQDKILMELHLSSDRIPVGSLPEFKITLKNVTDESINILKVWSRASLHDPCTNIEISRNGKPVEAISEISDIGSISEKDYYSLQPNQTVDFVLTTGDKHYKELIPGKYSVFATMWNYEYQKPILNLKSNSVDFVVY